MLCLRLAKKAVISMLPWFKVLACAHPFTASTNSCGEYLDKYRSQELQNKEYKFQKKASHYLNSDKHACHQ